MSHDGKKNQEEKIRRREDHIKGDALLKETFSNYIRLIGDADRKARIMIIVNSILLTLALTIITKLVDHVPYAWVTAIVLIVANLLSLFLSILSVRPEIKSHLSDHMDNILHYKKTTQFDFTEYSQRIRAILLDNEAKIDSLIKDLYFYGNLLSMKYRLMKAAYRLFYVGVVIAALSYLFLVYLRGDQNVLNP